MNNEKEEAITITFSQEGTFNSEEIKEITESFSKIVQVRQRYYARESVGILPAVLIFTIGFALGGIAEGFFKAMGSDLYDMAKKTVIRILKNKYNPTLVFEMTYKDTKISMVSKANNERILNEVFDTIDKALDIAINELDKKETPEMNEMTIYYDDGWILDSGRNWKPPKVIKFYKYNKITGIWELTYDWSQKQ